MRYYVQRGHDESGPYTLGSLRRRVDAGEIFLSDLVRSHQSASWIPVGQFLATISVPGPVLSPVAAVAGGTAQAYEVARDAVPPNLHWFIILLLSPVTLSFFPAVWGIVQAVWVRKIRPQSRALFFLLLASGAGIVGKVVDARLHAMSELSPLLGVAGFVFLCCAEVAMTRDLEAYYNSTENIGLRLSGPMVFFFNVFYFQYHLSRIARWKKTGVLEP